MGRRPRGEELPYTIGMVDYPSEMVQEMIYTAVAEFTADLPDHLGIDRPAVLDKIGVRDRPTRDRVRNLIQRLCKPSDGGRRAARLMLTDDGGVRLTEVGVRLGVEEDDPTARVLRDLIRRDGGISSGRRLRKMVGLKGRRARALNYEFVAGEDGKLRRVQRDPDDIRADLEQAQSDSEDNQADFVSFSRVLQTHAKIGRGYRDAMGEDGLYALLPEELTGCVLSGFSRHVLIKAALSATMYPTPADIDDAFRLEAAIVGTAMRTLRERYDLSPMEWVEREGVAEALDRIYDPAIDTSVFIESLQVKEITKTDIAQGLKEIAPRHKEEPTVEEWREVLREGGYDPDRAGAIMKLEKLEQGDWLIHRNATVGLFEAWAKPYHSAVDLSKGLLRLDSQWDEAVEEEV